MKKVKNYLGKAVLLGAIGLIGYISSADNRNVAYATLANSNLQNTVATANQSTTEGTVTVATTLYPVAVEKDDTMKYGYIDSTGNMVIQPSYEYAGDFSEGLAVVYNGKMNQVVNTKGEVIFETEGGISEFHNGLAAYSDPKSDYKQGYINKKGKVVIKPSYAFAGDFRSDNTAIVSKSEYKYYMINSKGKVLKSYTLTKKYNYYDITNDGYLIITNPITYQKGVMTLSGKVIIKPLYGEVTYLNNGLFGVKKKTSEDNTYLLRTKPAALFSKNGKRLTSYKYYDLSEFHGNYASVSNDKYTYFIDKSGKKVESLPIIEGSGTMEVIGDIVRADIDNEIIYMKKDGAIIWKKDDTTKLSSGITVSTVKIRPNKYVVVNYPKVDGLSDSKVETAINKELKSLFTKDRLDIKESDYLSVNDTFTVKQIKDLLIINRNGYDYPIGAAHGMPIQLYYFVNVKTDEFYQLKDLFKSDADYVTKLGTIVAKQMKKTNDSGDTNYFYDSKNLIRKDHYFYIDEDTLTIYFDNGEIAGYAAGFPKFEIPFKDISSIINTAGSFWKSFH